MNLVFLFVCFTHNFLGFNDFLKTQPVFVCFTQDFLGFKEFLLTQFVFVCFTPFEGLRQLSKGLKLKFRL
jgi:hypothetical protein